MLEKSLAKIGIDKKPKVIETQNSDWLYKSFLHAAELKEWQDIYINLSREDKCELYIGCIDQLTENYSETNQALIADHIRSIAELEDEMKAQKPTIKFEGNFEQMIARSISSCDRNNLNEGIHYLIRAIEKNQIIIDDFNNLLEVLTIIMSCAIRCLNKEDTERSEGIEKCTRLLVAIHNMRNRVRRQDEQIRNKSSKLCER